MIGFSDEHDLESSALIRKSSAFLQGNIQKPFRKPSENRPSANVPLDNWVKNLVVFMDCDTMKKDTELLR